MGVGKERVAEATDEMTAEDAKAADHFRRGGGPGLPVRLTAWIHGSKSWTERDKRG